MLPIHVRHHQSVPFSNHLLVGRVILQSHSAVSKDVNPSDKRLCTHLHPKSSQNPTFFHQVLDNILIIWGYGKLRRNCAELRHNCGELRLHTFMFFFLVFLFCVDFTSLSNGLSNMHPGFFYTSRSEAHRHEPARICT